MVGLLSFDKTEYIFSAAEFFTDVSKFLILR